MMVGHDHVHPKLFGEADLTMRGRAAIRRDQQRDTFVVQPLHGGGVQPISFPLAVGHIRAHSGAKRSKKRQVDGGRRHAVYVIVAIETHRLLAGDGLMQTFDRRFHIGDQKGIVRRLKRHPVRCFV